jgi:hypothetical protein
LEAKLSGLFEDPRFLQLVEEPVFEQAVALHFILCDLCREEKK